MAAKKVDEGESFTQTPKNDAELKEHIFDILMCYTKVEMSLHVENSEWLLKVKVLKL